MLCLTVRMSFLMLQCSTAPTLRHSVLKSAAVGCRSPGALVI